MVGIDAVSLKIALSSQGHEGYLEPRSVGWGAQCSCGWMAQTSDTQDVMQQYIAHIVDVKKAAG